jgi:hypothetical protein
MYMKQKAKKPYEGFSQWTPHGSPFVSCKWFPAKNLLTTCTIHASKNGDVSEKESENTVAIPRNLTPSERFL